MSDLIVTLVPCHQPAPDVEGSLPSTKHLQGQFRTQLHRDHTPGAALKNSSHLNSWELRKITAVPFNTVYLDPGREEF